MSVFATLRRKRDRSKGVAHGTVLVSESKAEPIFNSTPNLHKINPVGGKHHHSGLLPKGKESTAVFYPEEADDIIEEDDCESKYGGFGSRRSSSTVADAGINGGQGGGGRKQSLTKGKGSAGSLRHFASMISMFGSMKRTKSKSKMAFGSSQEIEPEKREGTDYMRVRAAGRSPDHEIYSSRSGITSSGTQSTESDLDDRKGKNAVTNMEPGVRSSSSSDDDDSRKSYVESDNFKKSDSIDKNSDNLSHNFEYTTTKTEEELKRTKIMIQGIKKFNMDPKKGIEFLVEHDILQNTPDDVAKFLKFGEGLSKTAIGTYLGEHIDFNEEVLQSFLDLHNFKDLILVQALRDFLWSFRLPGESQKIDRMMEAFAKRYCLSNPGIFNSTDTCYLLSYSIIMLNTTLHNPSVKDKPTMEQFIKMNRDVDCGKSLNKAFLVHQYNSILQEPFKIPPEDANDLVLTFFNPNIEGWLWKQGGYKTWKRRWFILSNNCLYYFKFTTDKSPRGIIPLENVNAKEVSGSKSNELYPFILYKKSSKSMPSDVIKTCKTLSNGTTVLSQYHTITIASINHEDRHKWIQSINQNNSNSDFYDVLTLKKRNLDQSRQQQSKGKPPIAVVPAKEANKDNATNTTPAPRIRKSLISQPSTAPGFEYKDKLTPEMLAPAGPQKDPNNYFKNSSMFSSSASISSGSAIEPDSSYGSFSDISRCKSESRILEHSGSISSVEHDTGSLGSRGMVGIEERIFKGGCSELEPRDAKFDLTKKLSVIEESQNQSDRSSHSSGTTAMEEGIGNANPSALGYRKLSNDNNCNDEENFVAASSSAVHTGGASSSDSAKCDKFKTSSVPFNETDEHLNIYYSAKRTPVNNELSTEVFDSENVTETGHESSTRYSRTGSIESDV